MIVDQKMFDDFQFPIGFVGLSAEGGQRSFGCADLTFFLRKEITEIDEKASVTTTLTIRQDGDTREIVFLWTVFLFGKVAEQVTTLRIIAS